MEKNQQISVKLQSGDVSIALPENINIRLPVNIDRNGLNKVVKHLLKDDNDDVADNLEFDYLINDKQILTSHLDSFICKQQLSYESQLQITVLPCRQTPQLQKSQSHADWTSSVSISQDFQIATACYDGTVSIQSQDGQIQQLVKIGDKPVKCVSWIPDSQSFVSASMDMSLQMFSKQASGKNVQSMRLVGHSSTVNSIATTKSLICGGAYDGTIRVWSSAMPTQDPAQKRQKTDLAPVQKSSVTINAHSLSVSAIDFMSDNQLASGSLDGTVRVWDLENSQESVHSMTCEHSVLSLSAPDASQKLIVTGHSDNKCRIWDMRSGSAAVSRLLGHQGWVSGVAWSTDFEHQIVSCSYDGTVRWWDTRSQQQALRVVKFGDKMLDVAWRGQVVAACGKDKKLHLFE